MIVNSGIFGKPSLRTAFFGFIMFLLIVQIVILSPVQIEQQTDLAKIEISKESLIREIKLNGKPLAPGIPENKFPEYMITGFKYVATRGLEKLWKLNSHNTLFYSAEDIVHSRVVQAQLFNGDEIIYVTSLEAKYRFDGKNLELYGDVVTTFPDGFKLKSQYLLYKPQTKEVIIPVSHKVLGEGALSAGKKIDFTCYGFDFVIGEQFVYMRKDVVFTMTKEVPDNKKGVPEKTVILSDRGTIDRDHHLAQFSMDPNKNSQIRFVEVTQPDLFLRARRVKLNYGDTRTLQYMIAYDDVYIKDLKEDETFQYATCGRADFDTQKNEITLTKFPQVYQDKDTVTGDRIILYRDKDLVEVDYSNAFSKGQE